MTSETLFPDDPQPDKALPHNRTATSKLAARLMKPFAGKQAERVFEFIKTQGDHGATDEEIQTALKMTGNSERPRRHRLYLDGRVKDSKNMRATESGTPAKVWVAVSPDEPATAKPKTDWPTSGRSKPSRTHLDESAPDMIS